MFDKVREVKYIVEKNWKIYSGNALAVELIFWGKGGKKQNFGDYLSRVIFKNMVKIMGGNPNKKLSPLKGKNHKRVLAIGSILHMAKEGDVIWGTGINGKTPPISNQLMGLDIRMVRGPFTRQLILNAGYSCPEIYGDPALLLPLFVNYEIPKDKRFDHTIIPNLFDMRFFEGYDNVISPFSNWEEIINRILNSEFIISSSLHGLIVAEAFNIPARLILSNHEPMFKYRDYLRATNRRDVYYARTVEEAIEMGPMPPAEYNIEPMIKAFPTDLWEEDMNIEKILELAHNKKTA